MRYEVVRLLAWGALTLCVFAAGGSLAQEAPAEDAEAREPVEEITVYGEKSLGKLKFEYEVAEESFYKLYNELNDEWKYDVVCRNEMATNSHIRHRVCWPRYALEAMEQEADSKFFPRGAVDPGVPALMTAEGKRLRERIARLAEEDPRLLQALIEFRDKYQLYKSERGRRCVGGPLLCGDGDAED